MKDTIITILSILFLVAVIVVIIKDPGKGHWENVGPKWACMLNPAKYEFCVVNEQPED